MRFTILGALLLPLMTCATTQIKLPSLKVLQGRFEKKGLAEFCHNTSFTEEIADSWKSSRTLKAMVENAISTYVNKDGEVLTKTQRYNLRYVIFRHQMTVEKWYARLRERKALVSATRNDDWV